MTPQNLNAYQMVMNIYYSLLTVVETWPGYEKITVQLKSIEHKIIQKTCEILKPRENDFKVISHGDYWINNIMYKYDAMSRPVDVRIVWNQFYCIIQQELYSCFFFFIFTLG